MVIPVLDAEELLNAPKRLFEIHGWKRKAGGPKQAPVLFFEARVRLEGVLRRGLRFRISEFPRHPNVATFQLEMEQPPAKTCLPLYRLEWRPLSGHGNGRTGPKELWDMTFLPGETHEHICTDNVSYIEERILKSGLQAARRIDPDFEDYDAALRHVCAKLNILNYDEIPPSNAQWEVV
jgi:hypothetical protein